MDFWFKENILLLVWLLICLPEGANSFACKVLGEMI